MKPSIPNPVNSDSLPLYFLERAAFHFGFLSSEYSGVLSSGMYDYKKKRIIPPKFPLVGWIDFRVEYATKIATFRISYGDRELIVEMKAIFAEKEYGIWEILDANGKDYKGVAGEQFVTAPERMDEVLMKASKSLRENMSLVENVGRKEFDYIDRRRRKGRDDWYDDMKRRELQSKYSKARRFFVEKRTGEAETLLSPFERIMNATQKKLLDLTRKKKDF